MNLVNLSGQRLTQLFTQLERRLKSLYMKKSSDVIGHEGGDDTYVYLKRRDENRPADSQTTFPASMNLQNKVRQWLDR